MPRHAARSIRIRHPPPRAALTTHRPTHPPTHPRPRARARHHYTSYYLGQNYLTNNAYGPRDPPKAETCLSTACNLGHAPSCRLLAVMFKNGDSGIEANPDLAQHYRQRTEQLARERGEMAGLRVA